MKRSFSRALPSLAILVLFVIAARAVQDQEAPPPPRVISEDERTRLDALSGNARKRLRLGLEFAEIRLTRAEQSTTDGRFAAASIELGAYEALIENVFASLRPQGAANNRSRDQLRRFEQALRAHGARIEVIRRTTVPAYAVHVATTARLARQIRTKALDTFFGTGSMDDSDREQTSAGARDN